MLVFSLSTSIPVTTQRFQGARTSALMLTRISARTCSPVRAAGADVPRELRAASRATPAAMPSNAPDGRVSRASRLGRVVGVAVVSRRSAVRAGACREAGDVRGGGWRVALGRGVGAGRSMTRGAGRGVSGFTGRTPGTAGGGGVIASLSGSPSRAAGASAVGVGDVETGAVSAKISTAIGGLSKRGGIARQLSDSAASSRPWARTTADNMPIWRLSIVICPVICRTLLPAI